MKIFARYRLKRELRQAGATERELTGLLATFSALDATTQPRLSNETRKRIEAISGGRRKWPVITTWAMSGSFAVFVALVISAQFAEPSSALYGLRRSTEDIRALVQPSYRDELVEIRREELEKLEAEHATPAIIDQAADAYRKAIDHSGSEKQKQETKTDSQRRDDRSRSTTSGQESTEQRDQQHTESSRDSSQSQSHSSRSRDSSIPQDSSSSRQRNSSKDERSSRQQN